MKTKAPFICILVFILLAGSINVDAANLSVSKPPANEPWSKMHVDKYAGANVGTHVSIAHHPKTGAAYVSYYDAKNKDLWMAHEVTPGTGNCPNNNNWECTQVDSTGDVGQFSSIDVRYESGVMFSITRVGIAYHDATNRSLKYATYDLSSSSSSPSWVISTIDTVEAPEDTRGTYTSMKFNKDGRAVIGYHASSTAVPSYGAVKVAEYVESGGTGCNGGNTSWTCQIIDRFDNYPDHGSHVSIDFSYEGTLYVAFYNAESKSLDYAWYYGGTAGNCSNDNQKWYCVTVDQGTGRGKYISLHAKDSPTDTIKIAYYDQSAGYIRYAEYFGSGGNCSNTYFNCYRVDKVGTPIVNYGLSMDVDLQGYPIIAYMDASEDLGPARLKIARPAPAYGEWIGDCGDQPPGHSSQYWTCKTIDGGGEYADEASYVDVSISPTGLATVAYSEFNTYADDTYLKVAKQLFANYLPIINK